MDFDSCPHKLWSSHFRVVFNILKMKVKRRDSYNNRNTLYSKAIDRIQDETKATSSNDAVEFYLL